MTSTIPAIVPGGRYPSPMGSRHITRRRFVQCAAAAGLAGLLPRSSAHALGASAISGEVGRGAPGPVALDLNVGPAELRAGARSGSAVAIGGSVPGPLIELYEGQDAIL